MSECYTKLIVAAFSNYMSLSKSLIMTRILSIYYSDFAGVQSFLYTLNNIIPTLSINLPVCKPEKFQKKTLLPSILLKQ